MTPAGTSNELDVQNEWKENTHTHTAIHHRVSPEFIRSRICSPMEFTAESQQGCCLFRKPGGPIIVRPSFPTPSILSIVLILLILLILLNLVVLLLVHMVLLVESEVYECGGWDGQVHKWRPWVRVYCSSRVISRLKF